MSETQVITFHASRVVHALYHITNLHLNATILLWQSLEYANPFIH
jgi:hypothetical protein